jgi:uncharacterized repeat protein (TIGR03803 family)
MLRFKALTLVRIACALVGLAAPAFAASTEKILYSFCSRANCSDGDEPLTSLIFDAAGNLYGTTVIGGHGCIPDGGCGTVFKLTPHADGTWAETVLYRFSVLDAPSSLTLDSTGNLYGVLQDGGPDDCSLFPDPCGQVFELMPSESGSWSEKILFGFVNKLGWGPLGGLILDSAGNLYGATFSGGYGDCDEVHDGCGTVFEASPRENGRWAVKFPYGFDGPDGAVPVGSLVFDAAGNLYGSSEEGGAQNCGYMGCGTIFKLTRDGGDNWTLTNLHYFGDGKRGASPNGNLIFDSIGNLYGTAQYGGVGVCQDGYQGCGAVFELIPSADGKWTYKILHEFENDGKDGFFPNGTLVLDKAGNLYGSTPYGGSGQNCAPNGCGTVFELTPGADGKWTERIVHVFRNDGDGFVPFAGLTADRAGNLYGTTTSGGAQGGGTIFEITP